MQITSKSIAFKLPSANDDNTEEIEKQSLISVGAKSSQSKTDDDDGNVENVLKKKSFNPSQVKISTRAPTLLNLITRMKDNEIVLPSPNPEEEQTWNDEKQSLFIESILIRLPLPAFYFDGTHDLKWRVIDGAQRLCTLQNFCITKKLRLKGLEVLLELEGKNYVEISRPMQRTLEETQITAYITQPGTPVEFNEYIMKKINADRHYYYEKEKEIEEQLKRI
jgi:hypothetical protein